MLSRKAPGRNQGSLAGQACWRTSRSMSAAATATARLACGDTSPGPKFGSSSIRFTNKAATAQEGGPAQPAPGSLLEQDVVAHSGVPSTAAQDSFFALTRRPQPSILG